MLPIFTILLCLAADINVRREGTAFRISGAANAEEIAVFVGSGNETAVLGKLTSSGDDLVFEPRFEIPRTIEVRIKVGDKIFNFPAEQTKAIASTKVEKVYPTTDRLPANQLKFYIQFSAPMLAGEAWKNLQLLDASGKVIDLAFLEIDQELWDRENRRLTILFDPGRIKRGVLPRDEIGASLEPGKSYTLQIRRQWRDEERNPLVAPYRKTFAVGAEDRTAIDPAKWTVHPVHANTREPLRVDFHESLDAALALRMITLSVEGEAVLGLKEASWSFTPLNPWKRAQLSLSIDTALEDLAGNKVGRPFDVDTFDPITVRSGRGTVVLPVTIR